MANLQRNLTNATATTGNLAGVDVASFQGTPDQWVPTAGDFSWAAVKITELEPNGIKYVNPYRAADWEWLAANKKGRIAYLFGHPSVSPTETVDFFVSELDALKLGDNDGIALDLETTDGLSPTQVAAWGIAVQAELKSNLHREPLLYTFINFATAGNCAGLGDYPLWLADPSSPPGRPDVPAPWTKWAIQQYDISGPIDLDVANYPGLTQMYAALGKSVGPKEPDMLNIGGTIVGGLATGRWPDGQVLVAGLGKDGFVQANLWNGNGWLGWKNVSPTQAIASPGVIVWEPGFGQVYYVDDAENVIQVETRDGGLTWA